LGDAGTYIRGITEDMTEKCTSRFRNITSQDLWDFLTPVLSGDDFYDVQSLLHIAQAIT